MALVELASLNAVKILLPGALSFLMGILITPTFSHYFYQWRLWRSRGRNGSTNATFQAHVMSPFETHTPRVGGVIIWMSVLLTMALIFLLFVAFPNDVTAKLEFISRNQTLVPLATLFIGSLLGLIDDLIQIFPPPYFHTDPVSVRFMKIIIISFLGGVVGWWFYTKLGMTSIHIPFDGPLLLGTLFIPFFIMITLAVFSGSVIDGIDGLSGGILAAIFGSYALIAFGQDKIDLAAFCAVVSGATLAFLWFNIPPARFYMGETGMMGLTLTLATIAFLTDTVLLLPLIAFPLFITSLSNILQFAWKTFIGKPLFRLAPLHHHLEAIGWSREKITMRYWVIAVIASLLGTVIALVS